MPDDTSRPGLAFRWTRWLLVVTAVVIAVSWLATVSGLYYWFSVGERNRVRVEYGRVKWRHEHHSPVRQNPGVDGGAKRSEWKFEFHEYDHHWIARFPLWLPFVVSIGPVIGMTFVGRRRRVRARTFD